RRACQPFVEMQFDSERTRGCKQCLSETLLLSVLKQRRMQPKRFAPPPVDRALPSISFPPHIAGRCTRSIVLRNGRLTHHMHKNIVRQRMERIAVARKGYFRPMLVQPFRIPEVPRWKASNCFQTRK